MPKPDYSLGGITTTQSLPSQTGYEPDSEEEAIEYPCRCPRNETQPHELDMFHTMYAETETETEEIEDAEVQE